MMDDGTINNALVQGAEARFKKAMKALDGADELMPEQAFVGTAAEVRQAIKHLQSAALELTEMMAYRKMLGVD